jgi:hypothetical protein
MTTKHKKEYETIIVWYKYPDVKPTTRKQYLCYRDGFVRIFQWLDIYAQFDVNPTGHPLLTGNQQQWWAELPTPPEVINE